MKELKEFLDAAGGVGGLATDTRPSMTRQGACGFACTAYSPNAMRRGLATRTMKSAGDGGHDEHRSGNRKAVSRPGAGGTDCRRDHRNMDVLTMLTVTEWFRKSEGWRHECCFSCGGAGMESDYCGNDFCGAKECRTCNGTGQYWVTPTGRHVLYPGGPFC
jgi:hypothetical protein